MFKFSKQKKIKISIIAAIGENREIGQGNKLLWHISEDLKRFKKITSGHSIIMGRKTHESIGGPLPGRINIIITRNKDYKARGCMVCHSLKEAIRIAKEKGEREVFICGGGQIYEQGIKLADRLYLTIVEGKYKADTFFPDYSEFKKVIKEEKKESEGYKYKFLILER